MRNIRALSCFCIALALLLFGVVGTAGAATTHQYQFHRFCQNGVSSTQELAKKFEESVSADATGHVKLQGCMANAVQFLKAFQEADPNADLTLGNFSSYIRENLEETHIDKSIVWYSSCIMGRSSGPEDVKMLCQTERVSADVKVFRDKRTGRIVLKSDCANPGLVPVTPPPCAYVWFEAKTADEFVNVGAFGSVTSEEESACPISIGRDATKLQPLEEMVDHPCDWSAVVDVLQLPLHKSGCVKVTPGWWLVRVPTRFATTESLRAVFCLTRKDATSTRGMGVLPGEYHSKSGDQVATIWYSEKDVPKGHPSTIEWWRWLSD